MKLLNVSIFVVSKCFESSYVAASWTGSRFPMWTSVCNHNGTGEIHISVECREPF